MSHTFTTVKLAATVLTTATTIIGLFIAYKAYRGLRRNRSRPMWFLSIGLILLFGVTYLLSVLGQALITFRILELPAQDPIRLGIRALQLLGVSLIAYSMWLSPGREAPE